MLGEYVDKLSFSGCNYKESMEGISARLYSLGRRTETSSVTASGAVRLRKDSPEKGTAEATVRALTDVRDELGKAAAVQPCPGCKYDIEQLAKFMDGKIEALKTGAPVERERLKALREVDFVNELTDIAIPVSKAVKRFARLRSAPT